MFPQSEKYENVSNGNVPLFAKHVPLPATHRGTASGDIKQYQVVAFDVSSNKVAVLTKAPNDSLTKSLIGVAAYPAKTGETVTFYTHGTINVDAIDVSAISSLNDADAKAKMLALTSLGSQTLFFDVVSTDPIQRV